MCTSPNHVRSPHTPHHVPYCCLLTNYQSVNNASYIFSDLCVICTVCYIAHHRTLHHAVSLCRTLAQRLLECILLLRTLVAPPFLRPYTVLHGMEIVLSASHHLLQPIANAPPPLPPPPSRAIAVWLLFFTLLLLSSYLCVVLCSAGGHQLCE